MLVHEERTTSVLVGPVSTSRLSPSVWANPRLEPSRLSLITSISAGLLLSAPAPFSRALWGLSSGLRPDLLGGRLTGVLAFGDPLRRTVCMSAFADLFDDPIRVFHAFSLRLIWWFWLYLHDTA